MRDLLQTLWQSNIEISLLLAAILFARFLIHKSTKIYNSYLLWLSIPIGVLLATLMSYLEFSEPPVVVINSVVQNYVVQPSTELQSWTVAGLGWMIIACTLLMRLALQHKELRTELASIEVDFELGFQSNYPVIGIDKKEFSPAVYGFFNPKIYFPIHVQTSLSNEQMRLIIQHEEHHITQYHLWLNLLWDIAVCLFWFNPLIYISRQGFRHDQELYCDYLVLNKPNNQNQHRSYGHALLSTVGATHSVSLLCSWKHFNQLEERIMNIKKSTSLSAKIAISSLTAVIVACTSLYAVSAEQYQAKGYLSKSVHDNGDSEIVWQGKDKRYVEKNGKRFTVQGEFEREMTAQEDLEFNEILSRSEKSDKESLRHRVDDDGEEIIWQKGELKFIEKNGERYANEAGKRRLMTVEEENTFDEKIASAKAESEEYRKSSKKAKLKHQKGANSGSINPNHESFHHEEYDDGRSEVHWSKAGKSMVKENDDYYVIDKSGKRAMSEVEKKELHHKLEQSKLAREQQHQHRSEMRKLQKIERELETSRRQQERRLDDSVKVQHRIQKEEHALLEKIEREQHRMDHEKDLEALARDHEHSRIKSEALRVEIERERQEENSRIEQELLAHQFEFENEWRNFENLEQQFSTKMQEFEEQMHEYELSPELFQQQLKEFSLANNDYKEFYENGRLSEKTMREIERSLAVAEKQFRADRVFLKKKLKQARADINKANKQLQMKKSKLLTPTSARSPSSVNTNKRPKAAAVPLPPKSPLASNAVGSLSASANHKNESKKHQSSISDFDISEPH